MRRGEELGILRVLPEGRIEVISPASSSAAVALAQTRGRHRAGDRHGREAAPPSEGAARAFVDLFVSEIWGPFEGPPGAQRVSGPDSRSPRPHAASRLEQLLAVFQIAMGEAAEKASERTLRVAARRKSASWPQARRGSA